MTPDLANTESLPRTEEFRAFKETATELLRRTIRFLDPAWGITKDIERFLAGCQ